MRNRTVWTGILVVCAVGLLVYLAFNVRLAPVPNAVAAIKTVGMTCGSCAGKIEKALKPMKGVAGVEVDVEGGWVLVGYDTNSANPEAFAGAVRKAGFQSWLREQMSLADFRRVAGRDFGAKVIRSGGCGTGRCDSGGCGSAK
ncbi:heavy-metal-associated domain-containing protein [Geobacter grbiciae]|uniref:heavy-metal-associated domain-containing protein n=1 Tax=Geobacter grbiciae TaxID=155042 RepID=UPI001C0310DE|nr:heavy-metal-associated domain-containing protein [Geobacter grbiciae]MBT1075827.1 heavy-metal-associated domain-containing protein [Geobacter grbiciae]